MRTLAILLVLLGLAGCTPRIPEGLGCTETPDCPPGQVCVGATCHLPAVDAAALDAGDAADAIGIDASSADASDGATHDADLDADLDGGIPLRWSIVSMLGASLGPANALAAADLNRDGTEDIVLGSSMQALAYESTAMGTYAATTLSAPASLDWVVLDIDVVALGTDVGGSLRVHVNDGTGGFALAPVIANVSTSPRSLTAGDLDEDGQRDLLVATATGMHFYRGRPATPADGSTLGTAPVDRAYAIALGSPHSFLELDGGAVRLVRNRPSGWAPDPSFPPTGADLSGTFDAAVGDLDRDGDDDVVLVRYEGASAFFVTLMQLAAGELSFVASRDVGAGASDLALADFDGDGFADLVVAHDTGEASTTAEIYDPRTGGLRGTLAAGNQRFVAAGRFSGSAATDLVFYGAGGSLVLWENRTY